jgi:RNA polymerase sigma factor (sigma-70 family)
MPSVTTPSVVRQIGSLFDGGSVVGLTDRQLIERFNDRRDAAGEAAFAALVTRHGPMIMHVCRQLLDDHHAEDAFQAVFLVLACKARSIRDPDKLASWLYGVALRTARKARGRLARRYKNEVDSFMRGSGVPVERMVQPAEQQVLAREQAEVLHREIDRLPGPFRLPIVLCYFEGLTLDEAARRLRCPAGTVRSRLARACDKLRRGLTRRGVVLSGAGLVAALSSRSASASVSSLLCHNTTRAAMNFAAGQAATGTGSASAATLAQEVLRSMLIHKLRFTLVTLLTMAACATGAGLSTTHSLAIEDEPKKTTAAAQTRPAANKPEGAKPGRMIVVGRVLDPQGKPVPNATTMVYAALKQPGRAGRGGSMAPSAIGQARCEGSGRFQLDAARTSSSIHFEVGAVAVAPGFGASWADLDTDADQPAVEITLRPEQVIQGRLFDLQGRPIQGVAVSVQGMGHFRRKPDSTPEDIDGPDFWGGNHAKNVSGWPMPTITDGEGRFTVRGVGRDLRVLLMAEDPRFARQSIVIDTDRTSESKQVTLAMEPAKIITGRVTYADTGKPVPHASLEIVAYRRNAGYSNPFMTDAEGRFRANPLSTDRYYVAAYAPQGQPYLNSSTKIFAWTKGALEHRVDLALPRGTVIRGKVTEEASGKPVAGATLGYISRSSQEEESSAFNGRTESETDGSFQLAVLPKPGYLIVLGASEDYVFQEIGRRMINLGQPGGPRCYAHAFIARDLKPGGDTREVNITLRRGMTVKGHVVGPEGQPVQDAWMFSQIIPFPQPIPWRYWWGGYHGNARNGHFELHGLAPDVEVPVFFLEPKRKLGATVNLSGRSDSGGPITIRLESCGTAKARLVDSAGKPLAGYRDPYLFSMVVTPGPSRNSRDKASQGQLAANQDYLSRIDPINYVDGPVTDSQGRVVLPALIPGATYRVYDRTTDDSESGPQLRKEFTVKPGETLDLGDILIEKPQS